MSVPSLLTQIQNLRAQVSQQQSQISKLAKTPATAPTTSTTSSGWTYIEPTQIINGSAMQAWTTLNLSVPANASEVLLEGYFQNSSGDTADAFLLIRYPNQGNGYILGYTVSGAGNDTSSNSNQGSFPCSNQQIDWMTNTGNMDYTVNLIGYR
ncbi:MAG TPA: hypothetical protein VG944_08670 [Fimbriimonas sp.]|nr:hypothetical protein [Fimbriimonas sp.]